MAISNVSRTVVWSTVSSVSVTAAGTQTSDVVTVTSAACPVQTLTVKADNAGTPASGDTLDIYVDRSADGGTTYDTSENRLLLCRLDTYTPSADPSSKTVDFDIIGITHWRLYAKSNAATNSITLSAAGKELNLE